MQKYTKTELFETVPVPKALAAMGIPTIISQLINLIYNIVDAFFIGRTGNPYMTAATTLSWTLVMLNTLPMTITSRVYWLAYTMVSWDAPRKNRTGRRNNPISRE